MARRFGGQSDTAPLASVLVRRPNRSFAEADPKLWHYRSQPALALAFEEHSGLVGHLVDHGVEVLWHDSELPGAADSIFVFDPVLLTDTGAIELRMGKALRRGEENALARRLTALGIPRIGAIGDPGTVEGGDLLWLDANTLAAGIGFRTNREGVQQLSAHLEPLGVTTLAFDLPFDRGPSDCLHLRSLVSPIRSDLAVVFKPLMPVGFWKELECRGIRMLDVPEEEFRTLGTNVLALGDGNCLALRGNPRTRAALESAGCIVRTYAGDEISLNAEGGPTCLTLPILRVQEVPMLSTCQETAPTLK